MIKENKYENSKFKPKYASIIIHNNAFSSENVRPLLFSHIKIHWQTCLELKQACDICIFFSWFRLDYFYTGESNIQDRGHIF